MTVTALSTVERWDELHQRARHRLEYPSEHVVRFLAGVELDPEDRRTPRALDIGCGSGRHTRLLAEFGYETHACDASAEAVRATKRLGCARSVKQAPMTSLPYVDDTFDVALAYGVFYYGTRAEHDKAVAEMHRVLRPGGVGFVCDRTVDDWRYAYLDRDFADDREGVFRCEGEPEDGMPLTFSSPDDVVAAYRAFSSVTCERTETTTHGRARVNSDWLISLRK